VDALVGSRASASCRRFLPFNGKPQRCLPRRGFIPRFERSSCEEDLEANSLPRSRRFLTSLLAPEFFPNEARGRVKGE